MIYCTERWLALLRLEDLDFLTAHCCVSLLKERRIHLALEQRLTLPALVSTFVTCLLLSLIVELLLPSLQSCDGYFLAACLSLFGDVQRWFELCVLGFALWHQDLNVEVSPATTALNLTRRLAVLT